jgi:hypothetical protein
MKAWLSQNHSDEEGPMATEGKLVILKGSIADIKAIAEFLGKVSTYLSSNEYCHMHLRDHMRDWSKKDHIDIEITVESAEAGRRD